MPTVIVLMHVDQCREDEYHKKERSGFDGMEKEKKRARRESYRGNGERKKIQRRRRWEVYERREMKHKNCEISQIMTWHIFIGWCISNVLCQRWIESKLKMKT